MVMISGSNTSPALTSDLAGTAGPNYNPGYYRTAHNDLYQGAAAANFAIDVLGVSRRLRPSMTAIRTPRVSRRRLLMRSRLVVARSPGSRL